MKEVVEILISESIKNVLPFFLGVAFHSFDKKKQTTGHPLSIHTIRDIWDYPIGSNITIEGTLSLFLPFLVGYPPYKKDLHLAFRQHFSQSAREKLPFPVSHINAYLSYTAGQMIWRPPTFPNASYIIVGLYQCIVRNSILMGIPQDLFYSSVQPFFAGKKTDFYNAKITAYVAEMPWQWMEMFQDQSSLGRIRPEVLKEKARILVVDTRVSTPIEFTSCPMYLDGDIWSAVEDKGEQRFISRFLDLANKEEFVKEKQLLIEESKKEGRSILFFFDQHEAPSAYQSISIQNLAERFGFHTI